MFRVRRPLTPAVITHGQRRRKNAGNSGWAAFTVDQLFPDTGTFDFAGTTIRHNLVWTSPNASLLMVAGLGTQPWFGDAAHGTGPVRFVDNTSGGVRLNVQMAVAVTRLPERLRANQRSFCQARQHADRH